MLPSVGSGVVKIKHSTCIFDLGSRLYCGEIGMYPGEVGLYGGDEGINCGEEKSLKIKN